MYYLYFNSEEPHSGTDYGYWTGKEYTYEGERYPICDIHINKISPKIFTSKKRAFNSAKSAIRNYGYVKSVWIKNFSYENVMLVTYESDYIEEEI